jgi:hypothetical protein
MKERAIGWAIVKGMVLDLNCIKAERAIAFYLGCVKYCLMTALLILFLVPKTVRFRVFLML